MVTEITAEDRRATQRLSGLLEYVEALVKLDEQVATRLAQHKLADGSQFVVHQHELFGVSGITFDISDPDGPIWLRMERLQRTPPPPVDEACRAWVDIFNDPAKAPAIREALPLRVVEAEKNRMIEAGEARLDDCAPSVKAAKNDEPPGSYFDVMMRLEDRPSIRKKLEAYCGCTWAKWAETEKPRRRSIAIYQRLFEIAQRLSQSGGNESIELIWGVGLASWSRPEESIDLPMIEREAEIEIAEQGNATISIRPRSVPARVELRPFEKLAAERLTLAEAAARSCLGRVEAAESEGVSPFLQETFEPILRICASQLDPHGRYLPDHRALPDAEPVPAAEGGSLTISDRYVLFARRRSANSVLHDIERLKKAISPSEGAPMVLQSAARTLVMGPKDGVDNVFQPLGNQIGMSDPTGGGLEAEPIDPDHGDLFFPKPFNDEQVQIVRRLEKSDGLVVQGPPGTGKTHTIANVICHMLATGRRVLVVSHGETALSVIRDQLPEGVRDLAISVTTSERDGLKQVGKASNFMLDIVNRVQTDPARQRSRIHALETNIVKNRERLSGIDKKLADIATTHLSPVPGSSEKPDEMAKRVIEERPAHEWFTDRPGRPFAETGISETAIAALFAARKRVGAELEFRHENLPSPANLPDPATLLSWRHDLLHARSLKDRVAPSEPQLHRMIAKLGIEGAEQLAVDLDHFAKSTADLMQKQWAWSLVERQKSDIAAMDRIRPTALSFLSDARGLIEQRRTFVAKPVDLPKELPSRPHSGQIFNKLAEGKNPFGPLAFGLNKHKEIIEQIRVKGLPPAGVDDWRHVRIYITFRENLVSLSSRWIALRDELSVSDDVHFDDEHQAALNSIVDLLQAALVDIPEASKQMAERLANALGSRDEALSILQHHDGITAFGVDLSSFVASIRLSAVNEKIKAVSDQFCTSTCWISTNVIGLLNMKLHDPELDTQKLERIWMSLRAKLDRLRGLNEAFQEISETCAALTKAGAPHWAEKLASEEAASDCDPLASRDWKAAWDWAARLAYLERIGAASDLAKLHGERASIEKELRADFAKLVKERTFLELAENMKGTAKSALNAFAQIIKKIGKGTGKGAPLHRRDARLALEKCYDGVPCWIMPAWRVSEQLPATLAAFDLVILDEASQSDVRELPALLRGKKILVVGDDRQVSPGATFIPIAKIEHLRANFLGEFPFPAQVEPGSSLYDLARVMFPDRFVMLKEHFRCVEPIIRFSMQFYDEKLIPLRVPRANERLDPPLVDIFVEDGERRGKSKLNPPEASVIVDEINRIINDPHLSTVSGSDSRPRSIGVISLIGSEQAGYIQKQLMDRIGEAAMVRHRIICGDSASFQGDERDVVFLSMIADRKRKQSQTALQYEQRFNVALSRARERMILVRSVREEDLNPNDLKAKLIRHFHEPMPAAADASAALIDLCQSGFERDLFSVLIERGYRVIPQVGSEGFSIDIVVEGETGRRLAIECDGDRYHGPERWADDMRRQRILERVGWTFWRCFGSNYSLDREGVLDDLFKTLDRMDIKPIGGAISASCYSEHRAVRVGSGLGAAKDSEFTARPGQEEDARLLAGDRIVIRYLDDTRSRPEFYILTERASDPLNGFLSISSPLAIALADASPGDEIGIRVDDRERTILYMNLERESRQAA